MTSFHQFASICRHFRLSNQTLRLKILWRQTWRDPQSPTQASTFCQTWDGAEVTAAQSGWRAPLTCLVMADAVPWRCASKYSESPCALLLQTSSFAVRINFLYLSGNSHSSRWETSSEHPVHEARLRKRNMNRRPAILMVPATKVQHGSKRVAKAAYCLTSKRQQHE
jgi:hypothetical protein